jgi:translation elongation factor EF-Ts
LEKLKISTESDQTIGDKIALAIGGLGENMSVRRAAIINYEPGQFISWYVHGNSPKQQTQYHFGKYGAIVTFTLTERNENYQVFTSFLI